MVPDSLESELVAADNTVDYLRENAGRHPYPVPSEHTNWIEEQRSWRETCSLSDLSHHQRDFYVEGPDALQVFLDCGINDFSDFDVGQAKQFAACNPDGYLIGDGVLFHLDEGRFKLTGTPIPSNWVEYNIETGDYDVSIAVDERYWDKEDPEHDDPPRTFRYQLQGPNAVEVMNAATEEGLSDIPFFNFDEVTIAGRRVNALRHSMIAEPGYEIWGPWEYRDDVRGAILEAGEDHGIRQLGEKSYKAQGQEKGWVARPLPAIFGDEMRSYREWLDADGYEATSPIGGSYSSEDVSDYYLDPIELGYERFIDWDRDFVGKDALQKRAESPERTRVALEWNAEDVLDIFASLFREGKTVKYFDLSMPYWAVFHYDEVLVDGTHAGVSKYFGYSYNERSVLSVGVVDVDHAEPGTEVIVVWGEEGGNSPNPKAEPHKQTEIRATVHPVPYVE